MLVTARSITLCIFMSLLLAACGSSPQVRFYSLETIDTGYKQDPEDAVMLGLGPLNMPDYLRRSQIVTRGAGPEMQVDEFNRWAEPLDLSIHRILSADVDSLLDNVVVVAFPYKFLVNTQVDYRLVGDVIRFDADQTGRVVLEVQWGIVDVGDDIAVPARRSRHEAQAAANDAGAVVVAMNKALVLFSHDIAEKMETVLQQ